MGFETVLADTIQTYANVDTENALRQPRTDLMKAQAREAAAKATREETDLAAEGRMAEAMKGMKFGGQAGQSPGGQPQGSQPPQISDMIGQLADLAFQNGAFTKGVDLSKEYSNIKGHEANLQRTQYLSQKAAQENQMKQLESIASLFAWSKEQPDPVRAFEVVKGQLGMSGKIPPGVLAGMQYDPEMINATIAEAMTTKDRLAAARLKSDEAYRKATMHQKDVFHTDLEKFRAKELLLRQQDQARRGKAAGNKPVGSPNQLELGIATDELKRKYPQLDDPVNAANMVASRAKALVKEHKGLDFTQAVKNAIAEDPSQFHTTLNTFLGIETGGKETKFTGKGLTPEAPMPFNPKQTAKNSIIGRFYKGPDGRTYQWDGKKPVLYEPPVGELPQEETSSVDESLLTEEGDDRD